MEGEEGGLWGLEGEGLVGEGRVRGGRVPVSKPVAAHA